MTFQLAKPRADLPQLGLHGTQRPETTQFAGISLDGRQIDSPAETDIIEQLGYLHQEVQYKPQPSVQSAPKSSNHWLRFREPERPESILGQEAMHLSSSAAPHLAFPLPALRTSMPVSVPKQVRG